MRSLRLVPHAEDSDEAEACADDHEDAQGEQDCEHRGVQGERREAAIPLNRGEELPLGLVLPSLMIVRARLGATAASRPVWLQLIE